MRTAPKIGQRVRYYREDVLTGETEVRECVGTVRAIYPQDEYDEVEDRPIPGKLAPESEWSAGVEVDAPLPKWWAYPKTNRFAPQVRYLTEILK